MGVIAIKIFLDRLQLLSPLRNGEGAELAGTCSNVVELQEGIDLASEGDEPECLHIILEGWACRYVLLPDGRRHISALLLPGDVADLDALEAEHLEFGVCTLTRCRVAALSRTALRTAIERAPGLARAFLALAIAENAALARRNVSLGRRTAREQVASVLCELVTRLAEGNVSARVGKHTLPLTQSEFADLLGLSPVHVNRVLQSLRADNLIRLAGKKLEVLDWAGLVDAAALQPDGLQPARSSHERCAESGPSAHQTVLRHA